MIRVLIVEDEEPVRRFLVDRLGFEEDVRVVDAVADAASACACLRRSTVDVVLLDFRLEGPDGLQLLQSISLWLGLAGDQRPAVLFCTGLATEEFEAEARAMGARGVIPKSHVVQELLPALRAVARGGLWFDHGPQEADDHHRRFRVLVANANRPARSRLSKALQDAGYAVTLVWTYDDVLPVMEREPHDLLILDSRLPGRSGGLAALERIAAEWPDVPVLLYGLVPDGMEEYRPSPNVAALVSSTSSVASLLGALDCALRSTRSTRPPALVA